MNANVSAPMPFSAASRIVSRRLHATHSGGCGFWTGLGTTLRGGICTNSPSTPVNGVSTMQRIVVSRPSSQASRLRSGSILKPASSASLDDSPLPNSTRPLETRSSIDDPLGGARRMVELRGGEDDAVAEADLRACAGCRRRGTPPAPRSGCTPRGSGARPPTRTGCRAGRRARPARARPGSASARWSSSHGRPIWCS